MPLPHLCRVLPVLCASLFLLCPVQAQLNLPTAPRAVTVQPATTATPPRQPLNGPGGSRASYSATRKTYYGTDGRAYWLFEPAEPTPTMAPVIVFNHGWSSTNPQIYGSWIDHIVRRGNIVIYPRYQADLTTPPTEWTENAIAGIKRAIERLQTEAGHVKPDLSRVAIVGHSVGGVLSANEAALAARNGLPVAKAVMSVMPGITWSIPQISIPLADLKTIPAQTLLLTVVGESDNFVRDVDAKRVFNESISVPLANKNYLVLPTDAHGTPPLVADHFAPNGFDEAYDDGEEEKLAAEFNGASAPAPRRSNPTRNARSINALDFGLWRLFDALCDAAFEGKNRELALGNTSQQRSLGQWSDGTPVKELAVREQP